MHVLLDPAVVELLAGRDQMVEPLLLLLRVHARIAFDGVLQGKEQFHAGEAVRIAARDGGGKGVDHESRADPGEPLVGRFGPQPHHFGFRETLDRLAGEDAHLLRQIQPLPLRLDLAREDGEYGGQMQHMRIQVGLAEGRCGVHQLLVDAGFLFIGERIGDLDDHHPVEQRLVLLLLEKVVEFREIGVRQDGFIEIDQREARHLDVLLLGHGEQQIEELPLHLENLDHLEHAAARGIDRPGPGPGARVAFVADLRHLR